MTNWLPETQRLTHFVDLAIKSDDPELGREKQVRLQ